jgi:hypothetical protein
MPEYKKFFEKSLKESGPNYVPTIPNTSGNGGAFGNASNMNTVGSASGTTGRDVYAAGDFRIPKSIFGGIITRKPKKTKKSKKKK